MLKSIAIWGIIGCLSLINGGNKEIKNAQPFGFAIAVIKPWNAKFLLLILENFDVLHSDNAKFPLLLSIIIPI